MAENRLKLNPDKTEFIVFGKQSDKSELSKFFPVNLLGSDLSPAEKVRNLGVIFDSEFSFSDHISSLKKSCLYHMRDLSRIRRHLSTSMATTLANALVSSRLDYCNSLFYAFREHQYKKLQNIQNILCRIVARLPRRSHVTSKLKTLHWLPVKYRVMFKVNLLTYKALNKGYPSYLECYLNPYTCAANTRRSNPSQKFLAVFPFRRRVFKSRRHFDVSFAHSAPYLWNKLPLDVRTAPTLATFRNRLKTHLFYLAYPP